MTETQREINKAVSRGEQALEEYIDESFGRTNVFEAIRRILSAMKKETP